MAYNFACGCERKHKNDPQITAMSQMVCVKPLGPSTNDKGCLVLENLLKSPKSADDLLNFRVAISKQHSEAGRCAANR